MLKNDGQAYTPLCALVGDFDVQTIASFVHPWLAGQEDEARMRIAGSEQ
jgi:hypothetical protein